MKLYYLTTEKWAKVILKERQLKLSTVEELNDPFELLGASIGDKRARVVVKHAQKRLSETFGLVCMSKTWQNPVMWAHYGDKHRGVCLGFDVLDTIPYEVQYTPTRLTHLLGDIPTLADMNHDALDALMTTKYEDWSYEQEWRIIVQFTDSIKDADGKHFLQFNNRALSLREIILGHRCPWSLQEAAKTVGRITKGVVLKRVRPSFHKFEMVRQQREAALYVKPRN